MEPTAPRIVHTPKQQEHPIHTDEQNENQPPQPSVPDDVRAVDHPHTLNSQTFATRQGVTGKISPKKAATLMVLLGLFVLQMGQLGQAQFIGPQGWATLIAPASHSTAGKNALDPTKIKQTPSTEQTLLTPQASIDQLVNKLSLDQKIGQMMMVQFVGATDSPDLTTMLTQYHVGSVLLFYANGNIIDKPQLTTLTQDIQQVQGEIPINIAIDQEGGAVDRLQALDGPRPAAATLGATNDPNQAKQAGHQDALDLASYGITQNLAPVVDIDTAPSSELHQDMRTFGTTAPAVTSMAAAYLQGLQQSQKVIGTLKHFPGLGAASIDPHVGIPNNVRTKEELEQTDWAPYHSLISQGLVHAIMVTHEIVPAIDPTEPASLSPKLVKNVLRDEMGFQGVIMTDSLTMIGITAYYSPEQAAAIAIEAGSDMIMGAGNPTETGAMINSIKQAVNSGEISTAQIDASVRRILLMKYQMGILPITTH